MILTRRHFAFFIQVETNKTKKLTTLLEVNVRQYISFLWILACYNKNLTGTNNSRKIKGVHKTFSMICSEIERVIGSGRWMRDREYSVHEFTGWFFQVTVDLYQKIWEIPKNIQRTGGPNFNENWNCIIGCIKKTVNIS